LKSRVCSLTIGADAVTGAAGNDTISGARVDGILTLNPADVIDGGAGTDTLTARTVDGLATSSISNVENVVFTDSGSGGDSIVFSTTSATYISGVTSITNLASTNALTFARVTEAASLTVNNTGTATTLQFADTVFAGGSDTATLNLSGATAAVTIGTVTDADGDYEALVVNATGAASDLVAGGGLGGDATTVTVNASVALDLGTTASFAAVTNFTAAGSTAGVTAVFANKAAAGTTAVAITGGAGADNFDISALTAANHGALTVNTGAGNDTVVLGAQGAADFTINGGAGTDTLSISVVPAVGTHGQVSGFETLTLTSAIASGATATVDMAQMTNNTGFTRINASVTTAASDGTTDEVLTISNAAAAVAILGFGALDTDDIDVNFSRATDTTTDALTITSIVATAAEDVAANNEETITFNSADGAFDIATVSATDMTSLVLTGDNTIDLGSITATLLATVDASGMAATTAGNFVANMSSSTVAMTVTSNAATTHTGILNITTGSGNDTVTGTNNNDIIVGGAGNDTINGGAGADTITGGDGSDTLTGGAGSDIFVVGGAIDSITDFAKATGTAFTTVVDVIKVDTSATVAVALDVIETTIASTTIADNKAHVLTGTASVDVSSATNTVDETNILTAFGTAEGTSALDGLFIFKADTNGDGTADAVQVWAFADGTGAADLTVTHVATLTGYSTSADLAGDFLDDGATTVLDSSFFIV
jgi:hypothetical protein